MSTTALTSLAGKLAQRFDMGDSPELIQTLKATAFKGDVTDAQMTALLLVANQYGLNPWTKEIYAFPDKKNGIVPVVGVDGWSRIINDHPQLDGIEFRQSDEMVRPENANSDAPVWMECLIYRKDRSRPIVIREYLDEVYRAPFKTERGVVAGPWQSHPKRFLRHKTLIQCSRLAFGFVGVYDQDEAERIVEGSAATAGQFSGTVIDNATGQVTSPTLPECPSANFDTNLPAWVSAIKDKKKTADQIIAFLSTKYLLTPAQKEAIHAAEKLAGGLTAAEMEEAHAREMAEAQGEPA